MKTKNKTSQKKVPWWKVQSFQSYSFSKFHNLSVMKYLGICEKFNTSVHQGCPLPPRPGVPPAPADAQADESLLRQLETLLLRGDGSGEGNPLDRRGATGGSAEFVHVGGQVHEWFFFQVKSYFLRCHIFLDIIET